MLSLIRHPTQPTRMTIRYGGKATLVPIDNG